LETTIKKLLSVLTLTCISLVNANERYKAAHAHFGAKGWSMGMIIGVGTVVLIAVGFIAYWTLKSKKPPQKSK